MQNRKPRFLTKRQTERSLLACLLAMPLTLFAKPPALSTWQDIAFHPDRQSSSYIEVWNFSHQQKNLSLYITFLVSNIGPGDLNNGTSVILYRNNKSQVFTAEYSARSLRAKAGSVGIQSAKSFFALCGPRCLKLHIQIPGTELDLKLTNILFGPKLSENELSISKDPNHFLNAFLPIQSALSVGELKTKEGKVSLKGLAGLEYMRTNRSPHKYATSIEMLRSYGTRIVSLGYIQSLPDYPQKYPGRIFIKGTGKPDSFFSDYIKIKKVLRTARHPEYGFIVPVRIEYKTKKQCSIMQVRLHPIGGVYVLGHVSALLRWVLSTFFAKPYILYYKARLEVQCPGQTIKIYDNLLSAIYIININ